MYIALLVLLLALGGTLIVNGVQRHRPKNLLVGSLVLLLTGLFFGLLSFWGEMLWFEELGQSDRFWTVLSLSKVVLPLWVHLRVGSEF